MAQAAITLIFLLLALAFSARAAGTVTYTLAPVGTGSSAQVYVLTFTATADASAATFPATAVAALVSNPQLQGYRAIQAETLPTNGGTAPTAGWAVTLTDANGYDVLQGRAQGLSASATQGFSLSGSPINGVLTLNITGNAVNSANVTVVVYLAPASYSGASFLTTSLANSFPADGTVIAQNGALITEKGPRWAVSSEPAAGTPASASIAAVAGKRHVADCVFFSAQSSGGAVSATATSELLRDGASGAGTVILVFATPIAAAAAANVVTVAAYSQCGLNLVGTTNTAMTFEFSASGTNNLEAVTVTGYDIQ